MDQISKSMLLSMLDSGLTYRQIAEELKNRYPHITSGLSDRSVRRYVSVHGLRVESKCRKETAVTEAIQEVKI